MRLSKTKVSQEEIQEVSQESNPSKNNKPLPDVGYKWGTTPRGDNLSAEEEEQKRQTLENYYTEEEKQKMRAKGINLLLKAEMNMDRKGEGKFWSKVGGTTLGGGVIK